MGINIETIEWLLFNSGKSVAEISKGSRVSMLIVSELKKQKNKIKEVNLETAIKLCEYANPLKELIDNKKEREIAIEKLRIKYGYYSF